APAPKAASNLARSGRQRAIAERLAIGTKVKGRPADHRAGRPSPISLGASESAAAIAATSAVGPASVGNCGMMKRAMPPPLVDSTVHRTGPMPSASTRSRPPPSPAPSSTAVGRVGWPANGSSRAGVKMRTRARWAGLAGANTNTVSGWLNSRAIACIAAASSASASSTTASGLPAKRRSVNTSSVAKRRRMRVSYVRPMIARSKRLRLSGTLTLAPRSGERVRSALPDLCLKPLDQAGVDQQSIEAPRLRAAGAGIKKPLAALENFLLLGERGIERQAGRLLHDQRQIGALDRVERGGEIDGFEIDRVDRVVGGEIARIISHQPPVDPGLVEPRLEHERGEIGLMIAVADQEEPLAGKVAREAIEQPGIVAEARALTTQIFVDFRRVSQASPFRRQVGAPPIVPGEMVLSQIDEQEHRPLAALACDYAQRGIV